MDIYLFEEERSGELFALDSEGKPYSIPYRETGESDEDIDAFRMEHPDRKVVMLSISYIRGAESLQALKEKISEAIDEYEKTGESFLMMEEYDRLK